MLKDMKVRDIPNNPLLYLCRLLIFCKKKLSNIVMYSQFRRVKTCYPSQVYERDLVVFGPSHHGYRSARNDVADYHGLQELRLEHNCAEGLPTSPYPASKMETTSLNSPSSSDLQSNIAMSEFGFADDYIGPLGNFNESVDFPGRTGFALPPQSLSSLPGGASLNPNASLDSITSPIPSGSSFTIYKLLEPVSSHQSTPFGLVCFNSLNNVAMWDQELLFSAYNPTVFSDVGWYYANTSLSMNAVNIVRNLDFAPW
jgi:hypothetical protein